MVYRNKLLKLRLQQTSAGVAKEWFQCIDMKDVDVRAAHRTRHTRARACVHMHVSSSK